MKGNEGRRGPLSGLTDRFSIDALRRRQQKDKDKALADMAARAMESLFRQQSQPHRFVRRGGTKRPMGVVKMERRAANKRARVARRRNRVA